MIDREALIERAWLKLEQAMDTGIIVTNDGRDHVLKPGELANVLRWVASLNTGKRRRAIDLPEEVRALVLKAGGSDATPP